MRVSNHTGSGRSAQAAFDGSRENIINIDSALADKDYDDEAKREERKRTGRYLAIGIAIFLACLGLYHAVAYGATKYATLLGAVIIMLIYLFWLFYASQRKKKLREAREAAEAAARLAEQENQAAENKEALLKQLQQPRPGYVFNRTYSIA